MHILSGAIHPPLSFSSWSTAFWVETEGCSCNRMFLAALDVAVPSLIFSVIGATPSLLRRSSLNHRMVKAGQSERPPEHLYRHGMQGLFMLLGRWQAFCPIYGEWVQYSLVDVCLKIFWYFQSPLQPHSIDSYRMVSLSDMTRDPRYLNWVLFFNADGTISLGATLQVFDLVVVEPHSIVLELHLILERSLVLHHPLTTILYADDSRVWGLQNTGQLSQCPYKG